MSHTPRLTLRTLLAYLDDTLEPDQARSLGRKVAENEDVQKLVERIKKVTRRRGLTAPTFGGDEDDVADPNTVAEYLSDNLEGGQLRELEETCLESDVHLAEVASCHQILTLVLTEPVRVPPSAHQRMYKLVESPASEPGRKPGKTIPVGGVAPPDAAQTETDDPDAALLLGMKRYAASDSWAGRVGLVAAVGGVCAFLALAVLMALPHGSPESPETSPGVAYALAPTPAPPVIPALPPPTPVPGGTPVVPEPKPVDPKKDPGEPPVVAPKPVEPKKEPPDPKADPGPKLGDPVKPPLGGADVVGKMDTGNVIVLTRGPEAAGWVRIDPEKPAVRANESVLALPGFKADVRLDNDVLVHLWGNTPDQLLLRQPMMQARAKFHPPAPGFDADFTLEAGRVYLTTRKPAGAKIRVRVASEVWDVALRNNTTEVLVQANTAFTPGTPYSRDGGEKPKTDARLVVTRGTANVYAPRRPKKMDDLAQWSEITWDSTSNKLSDPHPANQDELRADRIPTNIEGEAGKVFQRAFSDAAASLTNPEGIQTLLKERLTKDPRDFFSKQRTPLESLGFIFPTNWAAYSQAAIMEGPAAPDLLKDLLDLLVDETRRYVRPPAVLSLSSWVAQAPGNTALLVKGMTAKGWLEEDSDLIAKLLRGYSSPESGDTTKVDDLVGFLNHNQKAVRETALGNLIGVYGPLIGPDPPPILTATDVVADRVVRKDKDDQSPGLKRWESFLRAWETQATVIKDRMKAEKKP